MKKDEIDHFLENHGINCFIHFTHKINLESITKFGLLSLQELYERDMPVFTNGNSLSACLDQEHNTVDYVHLSFRLNTRMFYCVIKRYLESKGYKRIYDYQIEKAMNDYQVLFISPEILKFRGVKICPTNSASSYCKPYDNVMTGLRKIDWENSNNQAEILVPKNIPPEYISTSESDWIDDHLENFYDRDLARPDGLMYLSDGCYMTEDGEQVWEKD